MQRFPYRRAARAHRFARVQVGQLLARALVARKDSFPQHVIDVRPKTAAYDGDRCVARSLRHLDLRHSLLHSHASDRESGRRLTGAEISTRRRGFHTSIQAIGLYTINAMLFPLSPSRARAMYPARRARIDSNAMNLVGTTHTHLIILRGNSASGKSTIAREIRNRYGRGMAIIGQDVVRRDILWEKEEPTSVNIGMIELMARHALDRGMHVIVEGILSCSSYGACCLARRDHRGATACFYLDVPFDETVRRHATKPIAAEVDNATLGSWYRPLDLVPDLAEHRIDASSSCDASVEAIIARSGLLQQVAEDPAGSPTCAQAHSQTS